MLAKGPRLHDEPTGLVVVGIDQLDADYLRPQRVYQGGYIRGQSRTRAVCIEVAHSSAQQTAIVDRLRRPHRNLGQSLGEYRLARDPVGGNNVEMAALVCSHHLVGLQRLLVLGCEDLLGPARIPTVVVLEAGEFRIAPVLFTQHAEIVPIALHVPVAHLGDQLVVLPGHRGVIEVHNVLAAQRGGLQPVAPHLEPVVHVQTRRRAPVPAVRPVAHRYQELSILPLFAIVDLQFDLRAQKVEIAAIAGEQLSAFDRDIDAVEHDIVTLIVVPAVLATPPHTLAPSANNALGVDIVGTDAAVFLGALHPGLSVVENPLLIAIVAAVEIGVGHQRGSG